MPEHDWLDQNKSFVQAELKRIRLAIDLRAQVRLGGDAKQLAQSKKRLRDAERTRDDLVAAMPRPPAWQVLATTFRLSTFEHDTLGLCIGVELDAELTRTIFELQKQRGESGVTWSLALGFLADASWTATLPSAPLRKFGLLECADVGTGLSSQQLRVAERILHFVLGVEDVEPRLERIASPHTEEPRLSPQQQGAVETATLALRDAPSAVPPMVMLTGRHLPTLRSAAASVITHAGGRPWLLAPELIGGPGSSAESWLTILTREWWLCGISLIVDAESLDAVAASGARWLIERFVGIVVLVGRVPRSASSRPQLNFELPTPSRTEQPALWEAALSHYTFQAHWPTNEREAAVARCAEHFAFEGEQVRDAVLRGLAEVSENSVALAPAPPSAKQLWAGALAMCRQSFDGLAQRVESRTSWSDLTLEPHVADTLRAIIAQNKYEARVLGQWGFEQRYGRGLGISALFSGPSGTGKTSAAEVIAGELGLDLYRIDLAGIVSKWIGETEKNLRKVFDAAEIGSAVLLFDEADALFAKRTSVSNSHDRYANLEVSYLLQRIESFSGVTILTTNLADNIDSAFLRRLRFSVRFSFPSQSAREAIWASVFPAETPLQRVDVARLGQLRVSGAVIRNIALGAAFWAAERGQSVTMTALYHAARMEYRKIDQPMTSEELAGWPRHTESGAAER